MKVELKPHIGRHVVTGEAVRCPQYLIIIDGKHCGFLPFAPGSRPLLFVTLGPIELAEMQKQIQALLPENHPIQDAQTAPEPPKRETSENHVDPFDFASDWENED